VLWARLPSNQFLWQDVRETERRNTGRRARVMQMSADRQSETNGDEPEHYGDALPHERGGFKPQPADRPAGFIRQAETRDRADYYEALRAADQARSHPAHADRGTDHGRSSAWDDAPTADHSGRPAPDSLRLPAERAARILEGDRWGGGHRHGTGRPGKTEFPADWDDERIIGQIVDVARFPDARPVLQANHRWRVQGERDGVTITLVVHPDGRIWAAWPEEDSPGVIRNPREGQR
jgi:Bacterial EndoU nuclease